MSDSHSSEFEKILNCSFDRAVQLQHEFVTLEHVLMCCLDQKSLQHMLQDLGCDITALRKDLQDFLEDPSRHSMVPDTRFQPKYTSVLLTLIKQAKTQSMFLGKTTIDSVDLIMAMFSAKESWATYFLHVRGITRNKITQYLGDQHQREHDELNQEDALLILSQFAVNLNKRAQQRIQDPLVGREAEVQEITHTLNRRIKNNVLLVGHPGVGKTQIVEGLASQIARGTAPASLLNKQIWSMDVSAVVAGTKFRGDFEDRMKNLLHALKSLPDVILFIDEIHMIMGAGSGGGQNSLDVANILKPALSRGELHCIGSTTHDEYRKHFEKDRALIRRFHKQDVQEPSVADAKLIVRGVLSGFEQFHNVQYDPACVDASVDLSVKFLHSRYLPDKAIDLIDAAGAAVKLQGQPQVRVADLEQQVSTAAKISVQTVRAQQTAQHKDLLNYVSTRLFGQTQAVTQVVESIWVSQSGLRDQARTMGSFLLLGPSGVGKTELARLLSQALDYHFVRFDMSEFQEKHSVSRLIGSPPGYVGYSDGQAGSGALINALEQHPQCVLLIDEVEKAHPDVSNLFLQAMDAGVLTSANQKTVNLNNVLLLFTSNLGAAVLERNPLGFGRDQPDTQDLTAVKQFFAPEFRNRLDGIVQFNPLHTDVMLEIVNKFLGNLDALCVPRNIHVVVDPAAKQWLVDQGFDAHLGARPLARCIDTHIKKPMSREILFGKLQHGGRVLVTVDAHNQLKLDFLAVPQDHCDPQLIMNTLRDMDQLHVD